MRVEEAELLAALKSIDHTKGGDGICRQVRMYVAPNGHYNATAMDAVEILGKLMQLWPGASADELYPIPNPNKILKGSPYHAFRYHCDRGTLWVGKYGDMRRELVAWMIAKIEGAEAPK